MRVRDLIDVPDFSLFSEIFIRVSFKSLMFQIFLYFQQDFEKGFIYNNVREIVRIWDVIDVPHCSLL